MTTRREFIKKSGAAVGALTVGSAAFSAKSYARIIGANERINLAIMGVNARGNSLLKTGLRLKNVSVTHICDVDSEVRERRIGETVKDGFDAPRGDVDIRKTLEDKDLDALAIATPDHWHAPATLMGLQAGKHVYVEKPLSHNPREGEILVAAQKHYNKVVQMGNPRRSLPAAREFAHIVQSGLIGKPYHAKCWYSRNRTSIGNGKPAAVPGKLDWELWQGPAPRREYHDNYVHYNWHWFWHWGTGESGNNGVHTLDEASWVMQTGFPEEVHVEAARNFYADDDWQMYDTMRARYVFPGGVTTEWEAHSCNRVTNWGSTTGVQVFGSEGMAVHAGGRPQIFDLDGKPVEYKEERFPDIDKNSSTIHMGNFMDVIRGTEKRQSSPVDDGHCSTTLTQLANMAYRENTSLKCNPENGHIIGNDGAMAKYWAREYEPGWEMKI